MLFVPNAPGALVREKYKKGEGVYGCVSVEHDATGNAREIALAIAKAVGSTRAGVVELSFQHETEGDNFEEQILYGGAIQLMRTCFQVMVDNGYSPSFAYAKAVRSLRSVLDVMDENGIENYLTSPVQPHLRVRGAHARAARDQRGGDPPDLQGNRAGHLCAATGCRSGSWERPSFTGCGVPRRKAHSRRPGQHGGRISESDSLPVFSGIKVEGHRLARDIEEIAAFTEVDPQIGFSRPTFSPSWRRARDYVAEEAQRAGCAVRIDAAGNLHARPSALGWREKAWLCGSHVDSVPTGGRFDGVTGVVVALEVLRAAPDAPMELIVFAEEEGTTFNLGMLGSRAWAGRSSADQLRTLRNREGMDYLAAGAAHGVDPARLQAERLTPRPTTG